MKGDNDWRNCQTSHFEQQNKDVYVKSDWQCQSYAFNTMKYTTTQKIPLHYNLLVWNAIEQIYAAATGGRSHKTTMSQYKKRD